MQEFDVPVAGGNLRVVEWPGDGPVVLAAHGITANALSWARVAELLGGHRRLPGLLPRSSGAGTGLGAGHRGVRAA
jgi:hypothetical protein